MPHQKTICLKCNTELDDVQGGSPYIQPMGGLAFLTYGHYGSTIFDPMDGSWIEIAVCDECLLSYMKQAAPHLIEVFSNGDEGILGNAHIERKFTAIEADEIFDDVPLEIVQDPFVADDPQPYHPDLDFEPKDWKWASIADIMMDDLRKKK